MSRYISQVYRWANREGYKVSPVAQRVLVELLTYADLETGICWPSRATVAKNLWDTEDPSKSQLNMVSRAISALERAGLIEVQQAGNQDGRWSSNQYRLKLPEPTVDGLRSPLQVGTVEPTRSGSGSPPLVGTKSPVQGSKKKVSTRSTSAASGGSPGMTQSEKSGWLGRFETQWCRGTTGEMESLIAEFGTDRVYDYCSTRLEQLQADSDAPDSYRFTLARFRKELAAATQ